MTSRPRQKIPKPMTAASQKGPGGSSTSSTMLTYVGEAKVEPALDPPGNSPHVGCIHAFDHQIEFATALR